MLQQPTNITQKPLRRVAPITLLHLMATGGWHFKGAIIIHHVSRCRFLGYSSIFFLTFYENPSWPFWKIDSNVTEQIKVPLPFVVRATAFRSPMHQPARHLQGYHPEENNLLPFCHQPERVDSWSSPQPTLRTVCGFSAPLLASLAASYSTLASAKAIGPAYPLHTLAA